MVHRKQLTSIPVLNVSCEQIFLIHSSKQMQNSLKWQRSINQNVILRNCAAHFGVAKRRLVPVSVPTTSITCSAIPTTPGRARSEGKTSKKVAQEDSWRSPLLKCPCGSKVLYKVMRLHTGTWSCTLP